MTDEIKYNSVAELQAIGEEQVRKLDQIIAEGEALAAVLESQLLIKGEQWRPNLEAQRRRLDGLRASREGLIETMERTGINLAHLAKRADEDGPAH